MKLSNRIQGGLAVLVYGCLIYGLIHAVLDDLDFTFFMDHKTALLRGALTSLILSLAATLISMVIGFMLFVMVNSRHVFFKVLARIYIEIIMGTPLLVLIFVVVYVLGVALGIRDKLFLGFMGLTLYMSPYMSNSFQGAFKTLDKHQFVMMDFYGFRGYQKYRYLVIPQMIKPLIPGLINNLSAIVKGTSILSTVAISEIFYTTQVLSNQSYRYQEGYFIMWLIYLMMTLPLSFVAWSISKDRKVKVGDGY